MSNIIIMYPLDLTGNSPANLVAGEPHSLSTTGNRVIVPHHGPFFTRGLVVKKAGNPTPLVPGEDYVAAQLMPYITVKTGQQICAIIVIRGENLGTEFEIDYQVVGGDYSTSVYAIEKMIETLDIDERAVRWADIIGKPEHYPPAPHLHDIGDTYGWEYIVVALEGIRSAILVGDEHLRDELIALIDQLRTQIEGFEDQFDTLNLHLNNFNNPHQVTKTQVGLGSVLNYGIATQAEAIAGTSNAKYMTPLRVAEAIVAQGGNLIGPHIADLNNPHQVTKDQVGLGLVQNYGIASQAQAEAGTVNTVYMTPLRVAQAITSQAGALLNTHVSNTSNPHSVTKAQVGLGNVSDYAIATQAQAQAGTINTAYMTPVRVAEAITALAMPTINAHISNINNPHSVTKSQVGLASVMDYGIATTAEATAGTSNVKYMTPLRVAEAISAQGVGLIGPHIADTNNPHNVTKAQVGLSAVLNYGLATQAEAEAGTSNAKYMTPLRTAQAITALAMPAINTHIANTNNPHSVTKTHVGLGSVLNYGLATTAEAQAGTSNVKYMTPLLTKDAITSQAVTPLTALINGKVSTDSAARLVSVQLGTSNQTTLLRSGSNFRITVNGTTSTFDFLSSGNLNVPGRVIAVDGFQPSDQRLKTDIAKTNPRELWKSLEYYSYRFIETDAMSRGVLAQELNAVAPDMVYEYDKLDNAGDSVKRLSVNYTAVAFEMAFAAGRRIEQLEKRIADLEAIVSKLTGDI